MLRFVIIVLTMFVAFTYAGSVTNGTVSTSSLECQGEEYNDCLMNFVEVVGANVNSNNPETLYENMCKPDGRAAFACVYDYTLACGDTGFESLVNSIDSDDSLDIFCAITVGNCKSVMRCIEIIPDISGNELMSMQNSLDSVDLNNVYEALPIYLSLMCGPLKEYILCFYKELSACPEVLDIMDRYMNNIYGNTTIQMPKLSDLGDYIEHSCSFKQAGFDRQIQCSHDALATSEFSTCFQEARTSNAARSSNDCKSYDSVRTCVKNSVEPVCGEGSAIFVSTGLSLMYEDIPTGCEPIIGAASQSKTPFLTLLISAFLSLLW